MRHIKTALLAGAFAFATTVAFAQVNVGGSAGTRGGATIGGSSGSTDLNTGAGANVGAAGTNAGVSAGTSTSGQLTTRKNQTTGSGSANGKMKLDTK